ncbi:hypothetical protein KQQSB11_70026 [Klebsiella quasipneumoniae subsp. quasipneumoniae]|nr:hypothetical protein KQQSB11_70026 [Klebsiella quasipneumoniae subsp. quasipneumoniae]
MRLFLRRSSGTPIFRAVVFMRTPQLRQDNGGPGGAAFGLAGILWSRYSYPRPGHHP